VEDFFIIPTQKLDGELPLKGYEFFALEYCQDTLDIPLYYIEEAGLNEDGLEIQLKNLNAPISKDDWYVQLLRVSSYSRAS
jgi:hypothetical protein